MALVSLKLFNTRQEYEKPRPNRELEKVAEEYIEEHGGQSLGDIDTPAFVRKVSKVALMPPKEFSRRRAVQEPDKKVLELIAVLRGDEFSLAG